MMDEGEEAVVAFVASACAARDESHGLGHAITVRDSAAELLADPCFAETKEAAAACGVDATRVVRLAAQ